MKELWADERSKAGISLALWGVFLLFVFLLVSCGAQNKKNQPQEPAADTKSISNKLNTLLIMPHDFKMTIEKKDLSNKRIYSSSFMTTDGSYEGYVEDLSGMNRFKCNTVCYKVFLDHEEEEPLYYEEFINNINYIRSSATKLEEDNDKSYFYKDENSSIKVYVNDKEEISKITMENELDIITLDISYPTLIVD